MILPKWAVTFKNTPPDAGWSWIVLAGGFVCNAIMDGVLTSFGIFYPELVDKFGLGQRGMLAWAGALLAGTHNLAGILVSILVNRFGCRSVTLAGSILATASLFLCGFSENLVLLILLFGIPGGLGLGMMFTTSHIAVGYYFNKKRALATGICMCGAGFGAFGFPLVAGKVMSWTGWRGATWVLAGLCLQGAVAGAVFRPLPIKSYNQRDGLLQRAMMKSKIGHEEKKRLLDVRLLRNPAFLVACLAAFVSNAGYFIPMYFLPEHARTAGIPMSKATWLLPIFGVTNSLGRPLVGWVADRPFADPVKMYVVMVFIGGAVTIVCPFLPSFTLLSVYAAIYGMAAATYNLCGPIMMVELFGVEKYADSLGILNFCRGLSAMFGVWLSGYLMDTTNKMNEAFYMAGAVFALGGVICCPIRCIMRKRKPKRDVSEAEAKVSLKENNDTQVCDIEEKEPIDVAEEYGTPTLRITR